VSQRLQQQETILRIGYARTSTIDQPASLAAQIRDLEAAGCERVYSEQISAGTINRPQLTTAMDFARDGDTLLVTRPDRLARNVGDLLSIVDRLQRKSVALLVLSMGGTELNTSAATGRLMLTLLGAVAEFERALMLERQREGIAAAQRAGKYKGRAPTALAKSADVGNLRAQGIGPVEIAKRLQISRASVQRILRA
jgi:DNA invertase Pin-like site-specific DNA recombinase